MARKFYIPIEWRFFACLLAVGALPFLMMQLYMWQSTRNAATDSVRSLLLSWARGMSAAGASASPAPEYAMCFVADEAGNVTGPAGAARDFISEHVALAHGALVDPSEPFAFAGVATDSGSVYAVAGTRELFAPMRSRQADLLLMSLFVYALVVAASFFLARGVSAPVKRLAARLRRELAAGDDAAGAMRLDRLASEAIEAGEKRALEAGADLTRQVHELRSWAGSMLSRLKEMVRALDEPSLRMVTRMRLVEDEGLHFLAGAIQSRVSGFRRWVELNREYLEVLSGTVSSPVRVDVARMLAGIAASREESLSAMGVECVFPEKADAVVAPQPELERILTLLVMQAARLAEGSETPLVKVEVVPYGEGCGFAVRASGRPVQDAPEVLVDFCAMQDRPSPDDRVGLEVALAAHLVRAAGGQMKIVATAESGTSFMFSMPQVEL